ncbi:hypothetical protein COCNU_scaffold000420G000020 [Cocos nucifera]|nr:hypothetical protein [Cocos nucifera]
MLSSMGVSDVVFAIMQEAMISKMNQMLINADAHLRFWWQHVPNKGILLQ